MQSKKRTFLSCFRLPFALDSGTNDIIKSKNPKPIIELVVTWGGKQRTLLVSNYLHYSKVATLTKGDKI